jgi:hypothetical protein
MSHPYDDEDQPATVVRATRFEVVDGQGRTRAVLGRLADEEPEGPPAPFGLALLDEQGRARVWCGLVAEGPVLLLDQDGNAVVQLGVDDATPDALHVGAYLHLADRRGTPRVGWRVEEDGSVVAVGDEP